LQVSDPLFWINKVVDVCFIMDMVLQFYLIPPDVDTTGVKDEESRADLKVELRSRYLKGWFGIDLVSIFPYGEFSTWLTPGSE